MAARFYSLSDLFWFLGAQRSQQASLKQSGAKRLFFTALHAVRVASCIACFSFSMAAAPSAVRSRTTQPRDDEGPVSVVDGVNQQPAAQEEEGALKKGAAPVAAAAQRLHKQTLYKRIQQHVRRIRSWLWSLIEELFEVSIGAAAPSHALCHLEATGHRWVATHHIPGHTRELQRLVLTGAVSPPLPPVTPAGHPHIPLWGARMTCPCVHVFYAGVPALAQVDHL